MWGFSFVQNRLNADFGMSLIPLDALHILCYTIGMTTNIRDINPKTWTLFKGLCVENDISCNRQIKKLIREWVNKEMKRKKRGEEATG